MQLFAASIQQASEVFLHAGYLSAYPRALRSFYISETTPTLALEMGDALALKSEAAVGAIAPAAASSSGLQMLVATTLFFGAVGAMLWLRKRHKLFPAAIATLGAGAIALVFVLGVSATPTASAAKAGYVSYQNPKLATKALLHGILAEALINLPKEKGPKTLRTVYQLRSNAALPIPFDAQTPGMKHALTYISRDGWGRRFRLKKKRGASYEIRSAGADGKFRTKDDMLVIVERAGNMSWDSLRRSLYIRAKGQSIGHVFYRAFDGRNFRYHDEKLAKKLTGTQQFDVASKTWMNKDHYARLEKIVAKVVSKSKRKSPLILVTQRSLY